MKTKKFKGILHYIALYYMLSFGGATLGTYITLRAGQNVFYAIPAIFSVATIFYCSKNRIDKNLVAFLFLFSSALIVTLYYSTQSIGTISNLLLRIVFTYALIMYDRENVVERYVKLASFLAIVSLFGFFFTQIFGFNSLSFLYSRMYKTYSNNSIYGYGMWLYRFIPVHAGRNCGLFGEPGQYQSFLSVALYLVLFNKHFNRKRQGKSFMLFPIIFIITIITTFSTTGYFSLLIILIGFILQPIVIINKKAKRYLVGIIIVVGTLIIFFSSEVILNTIFSKISISGNGFEILASGTARVNSITAAIDVMKNNPSAIFGIGYEEVTKLGIDGCAGLIVFLLSCGIVAFSVLYGYLLFVAWIYKVSLISFWVQVLLVINTGVGQPNILVVHFILMIFIGKYVRNQKSFDLKQLERNS